MKPFLGGLYFAAALRQIDQNQATAAREYLRLTASMLSNTPERHQTISEVAIFWAMQHIGEIRNTAITQAVEIMQLEAEWYDQVIQPFLSGVHIAWAFEAYRAGHRLTVESHALKGLLHNPRALHNRGLLSIMAKSVLQRQFNQAPAPVEMDVNAQLALASQRIQRALGKPPQRIIELSHAHSADHIYHVAVEDRDYIVRIAKQGEVSQSGEILVNAQAAGLPVPALIAAVPASDAQPGLSIEQFISGEPLIIDNASRLDRWLAPLCEILRRQHQVQVASFGSISSSVEGRNHFSTCKDWLAAWRTNVQMACLEIDLPLEALPALDQAMTRLQQFPFDGPPILTHCDLNGANIMIDDNRIAGIIDWNNAEGNEPARDIGVLLAHTSAAWVYDSHTYFPRHLVKTYLQLWDESFYQKAMAHMLLHAVLCLQWLREMPDDRMSIALKQIILKAHMLIAG